MNPLAGMFGRQAKRFEAIAGRKKAHAVLAIHDEGRRAVVCEGSRCAFKRLHPVTGQTADIWWEKIKNSTTRFDDLKVVNFLESETRDLGALASRSLKVHINIQNGEVMVSVNDSIVYVTPID